ncbi:hypothetical protein [Moorena sp. SIO3H5]|uniref:hypothetical protein n=1 Tax=Moorena sp. SIO3H5 TaxID=2607834 RepID=UPI0013B92928|nr:hypothetical protein [Moorena sp. SIO3H5]NEO68131.1 hypothetical protein [Moorena sp. SIO3H5]
MGKWGNGEMGRWGDGEAEKVLPQALAHSRSPNATLRDRINIILDNTHVVRCIDSGLLIRD